MALIKLKTNIKYIHIYVKYKYIFNMWWAVPWALVGDLVGDFPCFFCGCFCRLFVGIFFVCGFFLC